MTKRERLLAGRLFVFSFALFAALKSFGAETARYAVRISAPETHYAEVRAEFPAHGGELVLMMPVWSPGFYRVEDYASKVEGFAAHDRTGKSLSVDQPQKNRWRIQTGNADLVVVSYKLLCNSRSVTTNWIGEGLLVLNPAAAFMTAVDGLKGVHDIRLELPAGWKPAMTGLDAARDHAPNHFVAPSYETFVDSPIVAGDISVHEFTVGKSLHQLVDAGSYRQWDGATGARELERMVAGTKDYWGGLPFKRYVFLNVFRQAGGGLEHSNSTLLTSSPDMKAPSVRWLTFVGHEYFHAMNVKRLRPVELGPFDFEHPPTTSSLWISEGVTTYGANVIAARVGLCTTDEYLDLLSGLIETLQGGPGRLKQTLSDASRDVWNSGTSGVGRDPQTLVSYYVKGPVVGFLLDARVQRVTNGKRGLQDVLRLAMKRYGGARGFTADEFVKTAEDVAGVDLKDSFRKWLDSTDELDYNEALDWFGLRFEEDAKSSKPWHVFVRTAPTPAQKKHLADWLGQKVR